MLGFGVFARSLTGFRHGLLSRYCATVLGKYIYVRTELHIYYVSMNEFAQRR